MSLIRAAFQSGNLIYPSTRNALTIRTIRIIHFVYLHSTIAPNLQGSILEKCTQRKKKYALLNIYSMYFYYFSFPRLIPENHYWSYIFKKIFIQKFTTWTLRINH